MDVRERMRLVREDCETDSATPVEFTRLGIGTIHRQLLAMIDALAATIVQQEDRLDALEATLDRAEAAANRRALR